MEQDNKFDVLPNETLLHIFSFLINETKVEHLWFQNTLKNCPNTLP